MPAATGRALWRVAVTLPAEAVPAFWEGLEPLAESVSAFEASEDGKLWRLELLCGMAPDRSSLEARLAALAAALRLAPPPLEVAPLPERDWVAAVREGFPPVRVGRFFVHGSHVAGPAPPGSVPLRVDAGLAFGSGEHETTRGCLLALDRLARRRRFRRPLDMGCGSGILALAAAKLWRAPVVAADLDPVAVAVTRENAAANRVGPLVRAVVSDGYRSRDVARGAPYDLVLANILARPLVRMAPDLAARLAPGGVAVLSGLIAPQETLVLAAHRPRGLRLAGRVALKNWHTLVLHKGTIPEPAVTGADG